MKARVVGAGPGGGLAGAALYSLQSPYRGFEGDLFLQFPKGSGTRAIAQKLADAGVVRYAWQFWLTRAIHPRATLQAGEYRFDQAASVTDVFNRLERGDVFYFSFTVPEGSNMFDIARLLESEGIMSGQDFLKAAEETLWKGFCSPRPIGWGTSPRRPRYAR